MNIEEARALLSAVEYVPNIQKNLPINDEYRNPVSARDLPNPRTSTTANITELAWYYAANTKEETGELRHSRMCRKVWGYLSKTILKKV